MANEESQQVEWEENENGTGICPKCYEGIYYRTPTGRVYMMLKEQIVKFGYKYCPNCGADMRRNTKRKGTPIEGNNESYNCENWIP